MQKLTLSVDAGVVVRAKRYAESRGTSVSRLVETMLHMMSSGGHEAESRVTPPVLAKLRGSLKGKKLSVKDHRQHLERKYL